ncbi:GNAT family N-acetyltransferase [Undibacterium sp. Jales W-56]|uniref:GNAT family N-acetyltransferase n=1 Tax=Undibacterium sp. Jales W-56 TaxID=2897325 RepID=UPI0021D30E58|nr:GNAT family N-acetyltransferase [Undibacterium sp. Jales W-56]MCU6435510.1 GNAT family N-acetyltransferase [Undibacterium sp. Jales W-56]
MPQHFSIRPATANDAAPIAALGIQVWLHTYATTGISTSGANYVLSEFTEHRYQQLIADTSKDLMVAEIGDHLVGYAMIGWGNMFTDVQVEVEKLYVQEYFTGQGIGKALLASSRLAAQKYCGTPSVWLMVNAKNMNAIQFYQKLGYRHEGDTDFVLDGVKHKNHVMVLRTAIN